MLEYEAGQHSERGVAKHEVKEEEQEQSHKHGQDGWHGQAGFVFRGRVVHAVHSVLKPGSGRGRRGQMVDSAVHGVLRQGKEQEPARTA